MIPNVSELEYLVYEENVQEIKYSMMKQVEKTLFYLW